MVITKSNLLIEKRERTPYAQLGAIDTESTCGCCKNIPDVADAGCGCEAALMGEIATELHERKVKRGNIAQVGATTRVLPPGCYH